MPNEDTLDIYFDDPGQDLDGEYFVITEELQTAEQRGYRSPEEWFKKLVNADIATDEGWLLNSVFPYIVQIEKEGLPLHLCLYRVLTDYIEKNSPTKIVTHNLDTTYRSTVSEVANENNILIRHKGSDSLGTSIFSNLLSITILIFDQVLSIIYKRVWSNKEKKGALIFPFPDRFDSVIPVIEKIDIPVHTVVPSLLLSWHVRPSTVEWPSETATSTLSEYATPKIIFSQIMTFIDLQKQIINKNIKISMDMSEHMSDNYDVELPSTVQSMYTQIIKENIRSILSFPLIESAIRQQNCRTVTVGGDSARDRFALSIAESAGVKTFYLPHSIQYKYKIPPDTSDMIQFVSGKPDDEIIYDMTTQENRPETLRYGRPYLENLQRRTTSPDSPADIIIATQPYPDWIREKFVKSICKNLILDISISDIVIKIHPSENKNYYENLVTNIGLESQIDIQSGAIQNYTSKGTILLTMNSNVGIESILLGSYCICYNPCKPFVGRSSYIDGDVIPYLSQSDEVKTHIRELTESDILLKQKKQYEYIMKSYEFEDCSERIAEQITQVEVTSEY
jgi:hypothetical protein